MKNLILSLVFAVFSIAFFSGSVQAQSSKQDTTIKAQSQTALVKQDTVKAFLFKVELTNDQAQIVINSLAQAKETIENSVTPLTPKQSSTLLGNLEGIRLEMQEQFRKQAEENLKPKK